MVWSVYLHLSVKHLQNKTNFNCKSQHKKRFWYCDSFCNIKIFVQVQQLLGDTVLRGEELKKYVNKLRAKSSVYKRQRAILASLKVGTLCSLVC